MEINLAGIKRLSPDAVSLYIPYPPEGSNCDFVIDGRGIQVPLLVWGAYNGDQNRDSFFAQEMINIRSPITSFAITARRSDDVGYMPDPLIIGLCTTEMVNNPDKLYNPNEWLYAAALHADQLLEKNTWYWIKADFNLDYSPDTLWLVAVTNQNWRDSKIYGGWLVGGYTDNPSPKYLNHWLINEPGQPNGWQDASPYDMAVTLYSQGGVPPMPGEGKIGNPDFPGTAQEGTPYDYSFDLYNFNDPYCGCPATMCWVILNRDTGQPISDIASNELQCGYYAPVTGQINFSGSGIFHGQLATGHIVGDECNIDERYNFDVVVGGEDQLDEALTCKWVDGWRDHGPLVNLFQINETIYAYTEYSGADFYGKTIKHEWWYNGDKKWEWTSDPCSEHYISWAAWTRWAIGQDHGPGTGHIKTFLDGVYMGKTNEYTIESVGDVVGEIDIANSTFNPGPFTPGVYEEIMLCRALNVGSIAGNIYVKAYEYPNTPDEHEICSTQAPVAPGGWFGARCTTTIPNRPGEIWPLGVKVWGDGETEPEWGTAEKTHQWEIQIVQPQPEICDWIDSKGGPPSLNIINVFELIDSYLNQTPPTGYSFIPTLQNVFGVIDYYLGLDGDAATGCDFFP